MVRGGHPRVLNTPLYRYHADDISACAALVLRARLRDEATPQIVRTRDPELLRQADLRVDVGLGNDPTTGDFDHHQRGGAGARENGIRYASFGLVWKAYGVEICGMLTGMGPEDAEAVAATVDRKLVQVVDAGDNGQRLAEPLIEGMIVPTVDRVLAMFNPPWDAHPDDAARMEAFERAVVVARQMIGNEVRMAAGSLRARTFVEAAIDAAIDPRVVVLPEPMPWREAVVERAPRADYVVFPTSDGRAWGVQGVPLALDGFDVRRPLPEAWAGRQAAELVEVTGVPDAIFCHTGRFYASAGSRDGALALVAGALA